MFLRLCAKAGGECATGVGWQGDVQVVLDAVVAREIAACLGAGDDVVRAEGVLVFKRETGSTVAPRFLMVRTNTAEGRHWVDTIELSSEVGMYY